MKLETLLIVGSLSAIGMAVGAGGALTGAAALSTLTLLGCISAVKNTITTPQNATPFNEAMALCNQSQNMTCIKRMLALAESDDYQDEAEKAKAQAYIRNKAANFTAEVQQSIAELEEIAARLSQYEEDPKPGVCDSSTYEYGSFKPLVDCIKPYISCDNSGDNTCTFSNECSEDIVLRYKNKTCVLPKNSRNQIPCFQSGTYFEPDGNGLPQMYKKFSGVNCGDTATKEDTIPSRKNATSPTSPP